MRSAGASCGTGARSRAASQDSVCLTLFEEVGPVEDCATGTNVIGVCVSEGSESGWYGFSLSYLGNVVFFMWLFL